MYFNRKLSKEASTSERNKVINTYVPSTKAPKYIKPTLKELKGERGNNKNRRFQHPTFHN